MDISVRINILTWMDLFVSLHVWLGISYSQYVVVQIDQQNCLLAEETNV